MDWKRLCCRTQMRKEEDSDGVLGEVVLYTKKRAMLMQAPESVKEFIASMPEESENGTRTFSDSSRKRIYALVAVKDEKKACPLAIRSAAAKGASLLAKEGVKSILLSDSYMGEWVAEGIILGTYQYDLLHTKKKNQVALIYAGNASETLAAIATAEAQNFARFLGDTPANLMTPTKFAEYARDFLPSNVTVKVLGREELRAMNMNLLLGVSNGSAEEPKLLEIHYDGSAERKGSPLVLVGKGITFDSGGISIKPALKMALMKGDMMGGASVVSAIGAVARLNGPGCIVGLVPLSENLPSGTATKPGDVHVGCAGKSVEIDNTDAEGRLILADALHHALSFSPSAIIDVATLTGAMSVALGPVMAGVFSNSASLAQKITDLSAKVGDQVWHMPCTEEYKELISSDVADLKNVGGPAGGSVTAAVFLKEFVGATEWAHIDIAGISGSSLTPELHGKGMTGRPVKLLVHFALQKE